MTTSYYWRHRNSKSRIRGPSKLDEIGAAVPHGESVADIEVVPAAGQTYGELVSGGDWTRVEIELPPAPPAPEQAPAPALFESQAATETEDAPVPHEIRCPFCSEQILSTARKCKHCGEWLREGDNASIPSIAAQSKGSAHAAAGSTQSSFGWFLIVAGLLCMVFAFLMDTGVQVAGMRVANLSLMDERRNLIIIAGFVSIVGVALVASGPKPKS